MFEFIVDGALEEISNSQGSSPIFNILETAAIASDCAAAALVRSRDGFDQIEASYGPLSSFLRMKIPNSADERELLKEYVVIKGIPKEPKLSIGKLIQEPLGVRFLASAPIKMGARHINLQLIVADDREHARRLANFQHTLQSFANLISAVMIQSGGLAYHSKAERKNQNYRTQISSLLAKAPTRIILADDKFRVLDKSDGFEKFAKASGFNNFSSLSEFFSSEWSRVSEMLEGMKTANKAIDAISVSLGNQKDSLLCVALLIPGDEPGGAIFGIDLRQSLETRSINDLTSDVSELNGQEFVHSADKAMFLKDGRPFLEDDPIPLSNFLLETLVENNRVHTHGAVTYHSLRRWRQPIRVWQIAAFKNLKRNPSEAFLAAAAMELTEAALKLMGVGAFDFVVPVACGNSGPGCFAEKLSENVAKLLNIEHSVAFHPLAVCGNSHPKRNASRPKMKLRVNLKGRILLIDDIATSGSHLVEATELLRGRETTVIPIAWVAA